MRVLQINSVCGIGSTGRIASDIHNILTEQGYESYLAYGRDLPKNCDTPIKIGSKLDNYIHLALTRIFDKHGFGSNNSTQRFIKIVKDLDPDIIHLHNIHGYFLNIELLFDYLKKANKPVFWTLHDCWSFTGHCTFFDYAGCNKWKSGCYDCSEKNSYPSGRLIDNSKDNYRRKKEIFSGVQNLTIVTPSKWLAGLVSQSYLREYPIKVINNGIDLEIFKPTLSDFRERYNLENKFIILGVASTWDRRKGFKYFIELSEKINNDEVIILVGLSPKQNKALPKNIVGITRTNNVKELVEIYTAADLLVNATLEDNFPTTNLEALACGIPIVTFNTGGSGESIDESCGIIVDKYNTHKLVEAINRIKIHNIYKDHCIKKSRKYSKNDKFNEYVKLYIGEVR